MGLQLPSFKELSLTTAQIKKATIPREIVLDLSYPTGIPAVPIVSEGQPVLVGSRLAHSAGPLSSNIHSSISGVVTKVSSRTITVSSDGQDEWDPNIKEQKSWKFSSGPEIQIALVEAGIVDSLNPNRPIQLFFERNINEKLLVIDACESEPFLTSDHMLMLSHSGEVAQGIDLLLKATGAKQAILVTEEDKREPAEVMLSKIRSLHYENMEVKVVKRNFPQNLLLSSLTMSLSTTFAAYEAVRFKKPHIESVVTVSGHCVVEPKNLWCRSGSSVEEVLNNFKALLREPDRILLGGPMSGVAITKLSQPISNATKAILALAPEYLNEEKEQPCIQCGFCAGVCPEQLLPERLMRFIKHKQKKKIQIHHLNECTECGNCTYICPSKIRLSNILSEGKKILVSQ